MSTFVCEECRCIENTALSGFWLRDDGLALCSECDKEGPFDGEWHGCFPRVKYDPDVHQVAWADGEWLGERKAS